MTPPLGVLAELPGPPACSVRGCVHFEGTGPDRYGRLEAYVCRAFPVGIPHAITFGTDLHLVKRRRQVGAFTFTPKGPNDPD